jgi:hypothetical protein
MVATLWSELFIKIADLNIQQKNQKQTKLNINRQFLPFGLADLTASVSSRFIRSICIQLHKPFLTATAISTRK